MGEDRQERRSDQARQYRAVRGTVGRPPGSNGAMVRALRSKACGSATGGSVGELACPNVELAEEPGIVVPLHGQRSSSAEIC